MSESEKAFESWAVVELMGHVRIAGRVTEEEHFGAKLGRCDIPTGRGCTGISASWCPNCGDCQCKAPEERMDDEACPLHRPESEHGEREDTFVTVFFSGASLYRLTPCDEATARIAARRAEPAPVSRFELPAPSAIQTGPDEDDDSPGW